jgi:transcriptional regulator with XRE-family HTH domain
LLESVDTVTRRIGEVIRSHRLNHNLSLGELAARAGLSKSALARIEAQGGNPSVDTLFRLSRALGLPLGDLLGEPATPRVHVIRKRAGKSMDGEDGLRGWLLHAEGRAHRAELIEIELPAGLDRVSEPHLPNTEELVLCVSGTIETGPQGETERLAAGDAMVFQADCTHVYRAPGGPARGINWIIYP